MYDQSPPAPRKMPQQQRSRILFDSIKEACVKILENEGVEKLTTIRLTEVSGVAMGSLYQYFPNIEAVLSAIYDDEVEEHKRQMLEEMKQACDLPTLEEAVRSLVQVGNDYEVKLVNRHRDFYQKYHLHFSFKDGLPEKHDFHQLVESLLRKHSKSRSIDDPEMKAFLWVEMVIPAGQQCIEKNPEFLCSDKYVDLVYNSFMGLINPRN